MEEAAGGFHVRSWAGPGGPDTPTVLLLHGIVSSRYLVPTGHQLAASCRVLAPDLPGFGRTPAMGPPAPISEMADLVAAWMAVAGLEGTTVVGHSVGAQIAAELAARHPGSVGKVVLIGPTVDRHARSVANQVCRWFTNAAGEPPRFNALATYELAEIGPARMLRVLGHAVGHSIEETLPEVVCPVMLVRGQRDRIAPEGWLLELQHRRPTSTLALVADAAHTVVYTRPIELARLILDFVTSPAE